MTEKDAQSVQEVRISVRSLVEFILRSGDIDTRTGVMNVKDAMQMGSRLHRKIQGKMGDEYAAEVPLAAVFPCTDSTEYTEESADGSFCSFEIRVEGRADGIITRENVRPGEPRVTIDEIKGLMRDVAAMEEPVQVHLAQAKCYAYFYCLHTGEETIGVRMSYANLETEEMRYFHYIYSEEELREWFAPILESYKKWAIFERKWKKLRQEAIRRTEFPFVYREGQRELAGQVYRTIRQGKLLFIQAPTGVGKTISTVFPAVKAVGEGLADKIFYLTARTVTASVAQEAFEHLRDRGLRYKTVVLTAKEKMCRCEEQKCNPVDCPYAKGHFDRINDALFEMITAEDRFSRERILEAADRYMVCPFELSLDLSLWTDAVIGDYNYVFHPRSKLKRFFGEGVRGEYLFLIDEAHNLVDRGRDMYSAQLYKEDFLSLKKAVKPYSVRLSGMLQKCNAHFLELKRECNGCDVRESAGTLPVLLMNLSGVMEDFFDRIRKNRIQVPEDVTDRVRDLYFQISGFLDALDRLDEHYVIYDEIEADGRFKRCLYCVNPAANLQECLDRGVSTILFSATLLPVEYYKSHLCTDTAPYAVYAKSVFDPARMEILIGTDVSSRYQSRGEVQFRRIAQYLLKLAESRQGNYMAFFPSYRFMEDVAGYFEQICPENISVLMQSAGMKEKQREAFLEAFSEERADTLMGFCVMGSIFGEGIDLRGDRLIGAAIVGTALPMVGARQDLLRSYYEGQGKDGFYYAYQCPGMNKVQQAAGRVIRTEQDRGVILLLDDRFGQKRYREMFPREWAGWKNCSLADVEEKLAAFWLPTSFEQ